MGEPDFISQNAEPMDRDTRLAWFAARNVEAKERGATFGRASIHPEHGWALFEGWKVEPEDQGAQRWQVAAGG
jgi:hypothetical protein